MVALTSPPLSLRPTIFGCWESWIIASTGRSRPVFAGTLYNTTGTELESATFEKKRATMHFNKTECEAQPQLNQVKCKWAQKDMHKVHSSILSRWREEYLIECIIIHENILSTLIQTILLTDWNYNEKQLLKTTLV